MRSRRRARTNGKDRPNQPKAGQQQRNRSKGGNKGNAKQRAGGSRKSGNQQQKRSQQDAVAFWGRVADLPEPTTDLTLTEDPAAVPRSLGTPPLPGQEHLAGHYFTAVYDRSVHTAGALAAAGGMIDPAALLPSSDDEG